MSVTEQRLRQTDLTDIPVTLRNAGVAGAGGAGFPSYAKWQRIDEVDHLLVNHQESEPNYYIDKWLGRERDAELATLFEALLERGAFDTVVVGAKRKDREAWMRPLEDHTDGTVYMPEDLPIDADAEEGVVFAYTVDDYRFGMENVLLKMVGDVVVGQDLPMDHGWLVQNTETMYHVYRALEDGAPVTTTFAHVDGQTPDHRFLEVPIGTPASTMIAAAGRPVAELDDDSVLLDGGPGWCFEIDPGAEEFGVRKRTNAILVTDRQTVDANELGSGRVDVRDQRDWRDSVDDTAPSATLDPDHVRIPLISNPAFEGIVEPSQPIVEEGRTVSAGEMIARPAGEVSNAQHASIDGTVTEITDSHVEIRADVDARRPVDLREPIEANDMLYWTACSECGAYVVHPETASQAEPTAFVCEDCRDAWGESVG